MKSEVLKNSKIRKHLSNWKKKKQKKKIISHTFAAAEDFPNAIYFTQVLYKYS